MRLKQEVKAVMGWQSVGGEREGSFCSARGTSLASKPPRFIRLPTPASTYCSTPGCQGAGEHKDTGGSCPWALKVHGLAGVNASVPGPGLFHI